MDTLHGAAFTEEAAGAGISSTSTEAIGGYPSMEEGGTVPSEGADSVAYSQHGGAVSEQIGSNPDFIIIGLCIQIFGPMRMVQ